MSLVRQIHRKLDAIVPLKYRSKHISFVLVVFGAALDNINVAGTVSVYSSIQTHFNADSPTVTWVLSAYALTLGSFIMLGGKLTDILGPKEVFLVGLLGSSLMCLICAAIENSIIALIIFRAFQGVFASLTIPSLFPIAFSYYFNSCFPQAILAMMLMFTSSIGVGLVIGGAFALTPIGYKGLYYFSFAFGFAAAVILYFTMYPVETQEENKTASWKNMDFAGTLMVVVGLLLIILGLTEGGVSWERPSAYVPLPVGVLVLIVGGIYELVYIQGYKDKLKCQEESVPKSDLFEPTLLKKDWKTDLIMLIPKEAFSIINFIPFLVGIVACFLTYIGMITVSIQYSQVIEGDGTLIASIKTLPLTVGVSSGVLINRESLIYKISMKWVLVLSQAASVFLMLWESYHNYDVHNNYWIFTFVPMFFYGLFTTTFTSVYFNAILRNTPGYLQGVVAGLLQTASEVGVCLGNALMATLIGVMTPVTSEEQKAHYNRRFKHCFYVLIAIQVVHVIAMLCLKDQKAVEATQGLEEKGEDVESGLDQEVEQSAASHA